MSIVRKFLTVKNSILLSLSVAFFTAGYVTLFYTFTPLPGVDIRNVVSKQSVILTDRNDEFLFDFSINEKRTFVPYQEISKNIINATIAIEDHLFFEHNGIRADAFLRALINNIRTLSFSQGGSTITQQVIKNVFLTTEKKIERKMKEFLLAIKLEKQLGKEEILEMYLNTISYGGVSYGVAEASKSFYGKAPDELTIAESAYLAAIPKAPTYYSPYGRNRKALEARKNQVLQLMLEHNLITRGEYREARAEEVYFQSQNAFSIRAPHFVFFVKEQLEKEHGAGLKNLEGKQVKTTIDIAMQEEIEKMMQEFVKTDLEKQFAVSNIASVVLSAKTGEILSMVGSRDFFDNAVNGRVNIITSLRQPGSTFKPIAYAKAIEKGLTPQTIVYDVPTQFTAFCDKDRFESTKSGCYAPVNYTGKFVGPVSLRDALAQSINVPAVKVLYIANVAEVIQQAKKMGITSLTQGQNHYGLSLVLGGAEVTPLEIAQAYGVFANEGMLAPYVWRYGEQKQEKRVLGRQTAQDITDMLFDDDARAPVFGRGSALHITNPPVAVKTGTTNNARDIWVIGYSPDIVVLVWAGNSDNTPLEDNAAGFYLAPLMKNIITTVAKQYGEQGTYFTRNTVPPNHGPEILFGAIDTDNPHTILHYIQRNKPTRRAENPLEEPQYEHWEYGVQDWLEQNDLQEGYDGRRNSAVKNFSVKSPRSTIYLNEITTIEVTKIPTQNVQYEFYVNGTLIGSSRLPMLSFNPEKLLDKNEREAAIRVIANTEEGVYVAEEVYEIE
ncbi:MAG: transglycosylase domain-containing protein [Candidatus Kaiserbacteria bacterium]|nr:transglycosylase domain-containing protein [Candidatus Kaiserbacteria bacterium]